MKSYTYFYVKYYYQIMSSFICVIIRYITINLLTIEVIYSILITSLDFPCLLLSPSLIIYYAYLYIKDILDTIYQNIL